MDGWITSDNLKAFVRLVSYLAGYIYYDEDYEWLAIENGLKDTDVDENRWYTFPIEGKQRLTLELSRDPNSDGETYTRITSDDDLSPDLKVQLDLLVSICQDYTVRWRH